MASIIVLCPLDRHADGNAFLSAIGIPETTRFNDVLCPVVRNAIGTERRMLYIQCSQDVASAAALEPAGVLTVATNADPEAYMSANNLTQVRAA